MQYDKMKLTVGVFMIVLMVSLSGFIYAVLDAKGVFKKRYHYYFVTESAASFSVGMPVKFSGFAIGSIDDIKLLDDGEVRIGFSITEENRKWINKFTYLLLKKPLLGSAHIEVLATSGNGYLKPNSKLPIIITDDVNDLVAKLEPVVDRLLNIIKNIETLTNDIAKKDSSFNKTMQNLETFSAKLAQSDSLLTSVTGDKASTQALINSLHEMEKILKDVSRITQDLHQDLITPTSKSLQELHLILVDVHQKLIELDPMIKTLGDSSSEVGSLKETLQSLIIKSNDLMDKVDALLVNQKDANVELP